MNGASATPRATAAFCCSSHLNERKVRIEVGCGLEGRITNDVAAAIIADVILPDYRSGDLKAGTMAGVDALVDRLAAPASANDNLRTTSICKTKAKQAA